MDARGDASASRVGPYRLCFELASGGMATVYLGYEDPPPDARPRFAAVKVIHPHLANDPGFAEMFADEADIAARIRHPNVCEVYGFEVSPSGSYLALEYLLGEPMAAIFRKLARARSAARGELARFVCRALADACLGLHAAHELTDDDGTPLEIVHRDVSPANLVLTFDGITKVLDFGVARAARKRHRTETGMLKGKLAYIAPECLRGQRADARADVWAIGVVTWELLTGHRLFRRGNDIDMLRAVMEAPIRPPSAVRPALPKSVDEVVMSALARDPAKRCPSAAELARALGEVASEEGAIAPRDLAGWLDALFPGARSRKEQLLEIAAQMAADEPVARLEPTPGTEGTYYVPVSVSADAERERTRVFEREPSAKPAPPRGSRGWALAIALGAAVGVGSAAAATYGIDLSRAAPTPAPPASAPPAERPPATELRLRAGAGFARGAYVLELLESDEDELVLRIRLEGGEPAGADEAPPPDPPAGAAHDERAGPTDRPAPRPSAIAPRARPQPVDRDPPSAAPDQAR